MALEEGSENKDDQQPPGSPAAPSNANATPVQNGGLGSKPVPSPSPPTAQAMIEVQYMPLRTFAEQNDKKYGIELMGGFYHEQQTASHYADTEENWHRLMDEFSGREVK